MKKSFIYSALAILAISGCQVNESEIGITNKQEVLPGQDSKPFVAIIDEDNLSREAKTSIDNSGNVLWKQGDQISIFAGSTVNERYQVTDESDGNTAASLNKIPDGGFIAGTSIENNVAFYPYASTAAIAKNGGNYVISGIELPSTQNYVAGSFGNGAFPMAAVTGSTEDMDLKFKNVLGGLKLQLKGTATIASITVTGNNDEILCGAAEVTVSTESAPSINLTNAAAKSVTLNCGAGVALDAETATSFIIALPPMTMTGGFMVIVTDSESKQMEIKTTKSQTIPRSNLLKMPAVDYVGASVIHPLKFTSTGSTSISLTKTGSPADITLDYKVDDGEWASYTVGNAIALTDGQKLSFRAGAGGNASFSQSSEKYYSFIVSGSGTVAASGDIMSLIDKEGGLTIPSSYCFYRLFYDCSGLTSAPELPATTLANYCYKDMFFRCTGLAYAPELPATTLADYCYEDMFFYCIGLTSAPELPATNLANYCYKYMFQSCNGLTSGPELPATTLADGCYNLMFYRCRGLITAPELPATTLAGACYQSMFNGCTSLTTPPSAILATTMADNCCKQMFEGCTSLTSGPELSATTLAYGCYQSMFRDCTNLTTAPELPATNLAQNCYCGMFGGCTGLTSAPELSATTLAHSCYLLMFDGCTSLTVAPDLPATSLETQCYSQMFSGCTSLTTAPELPATTLAGSCYERMFQSCTSLTTAPELPVTTFSVSWTMCYNSMFDGCTSLTTAPELPATTLADYCYGYMFRGCTSLTTAPELPATTLKNGCYNYMFKNCSNLNYIKALFTTTPSSSYTNNWTSGVAATGTFIKSRSASWNVTGVSGVPTGWTIKTE